MNKGTCIHFNGAQNELCERGVRYDQFKDGKPCIQFIEKNARGGTYFKPGEAVAERKPFPNTAPKSACPFFQEPNEEQVQAAREKTEAYMVKIRAALRVANKWRVVPKPTTDRRAVVLCPACDGKLHLSQSSYNGHVHGKCETEGCVQWME